MHSDIRKAHERIAALRDALFQGGPDEIDQCLPALEQSAAALKVLQPGPSMANDLHLLRTELKRTAGLIVSGDKLWRGWARILGSATGYTAAGEPVSLGASAQVSIRG